MIHYAGMVPIPAERARRERLTSKLWHGLKDQLNDCDRRHEFG
jgi:hypothetical protein